MAHLMNNFNKIFLFVLLLCAPCIETALRYKLGWAKRDVRAEMGAYLDRLSIFEDEIEAFERELQSLIPSDLQYEKIKRDLAIAQQNKHRLEIEHDIWLDHHDSIKFQ